MATCAMEPAARRVLARKVGTHLAALHGKRRHYSPQIVKAAVRRCGFGPACDCWAMSLFASAEDFGAYHAATGEACDYASMNAQMLDAIAPPHLPDVPTFGAGATDVDPWTALDFGSIDLPDSSA
jgi:hypothetical protein